MSSFKDNYQLQKILHNGCIYLKFYKKLRFKEFGRNAGHICNLNVNLQYEFKIRQSAFCTQSYRWASFGRCPYRIVQLFIR